MNPVGNSGPAIARLETEQDIISNWVKEVFRSLMKSRGEKS
jgi:uncharacterized protein (UPF0335 family)